MHLTTFHTVLHLLWGSFILVFFPLSNCTRGDLLFSVIIEQIEEESHIIEKQKRRWRMHLHYKNTWCF